MIKQHLKQFNQDFNVTVESLQTVVTPKDINLADRQNQQAERLGNWNLICKELDIVAILVEDDIKSKYIAGDLKEIMQLFVRIERYIQKITIGVDVLKF